MNDKNTNQDLNSDKSIILKAIELVLDKPQEIKIATEKPLSSYTKKYGYSKSPKAFSSLI